MLKGGFLDSSRAARRAHARAERRKFVAGSVRTVSVVVRDLRGSALDVTLLLALPLVYAAAAYLVVSLPARWVTRRTPFTGTSFLWFSGAVVISIIGLVRALQNAPPVAPVRPKFAKAMFAVSWAAALLMTLGDLSR
jgi:hypothetical protein